MSSVPVRVLALARTFWEKATILHSCAHGGVERLGTRQSRHYYDVFRLATGPGREAALSNLDLLSIVAEHKRRFFPVAWAKYEEARRGTLRLVPPPDVARKLRSDYRQMEAMFFGEAPSFDEIMAGIADLEAELNSQTAPAGGADA